MVDGHHGQRGHVQPPVEWEANQKLEHVTTRCHQMEEQPVQGLAVILPPVTLEFAQV